MTEGGKRPAVRSVEPAAWRWKYEGDTSWTLSKTAPDQPIFSHKVICEPLFTSVAQASSKQLSDFAELKLLIDEYDPTNSDWNFRRGVLLDILVRLWPQASPLPSAQRLCPTCKQAESINCSDSFHVTIKVPSTNQGTPK